VNPAKLDPKIDRPAGPIDGSVPVVPFEGADGKPIAIYVNYALHLDTVGGDQYSADYPYMLSQILSAAKGKHMVTVLTIGLCAQPE
jgi:neutral ceramidase